MRSLGTPEHRGSPGASFAAGTLVVTGSGKAVAISALRPGAKVISTNVRTGKTGAHRVSRVLVHHDTDLYNLKVRSGHGAVVIRTTSSHLFWDVSLNKWVPAGKLKKGEHLRTPSGQDAMAVGGWTPKNQQGWMWDLTVPGPHDFYVAVGATAVLVHNCGDVTVSPMASDWATKGAHVHIEGNEVRVFPNGEGGVGAEPIRLSNGRVATSQQVQRVLDCLEGYSGRRGASK